MSHTYVQKHPERTPSPASPEVQQSEPQGKLQEQIARVAGMQNAGKKDPIANIEETFRQSFSASESVGYSALVGMRSSSPGLVGPKGRPAEEDEIYSIGKGKNSASPKGEKKDQSAISNLVRDSSMDSNFVSEDGELDRFEEIGLRKGKLSAAVLKGTSDMMLFSCLRRAGKGGEGTNEAERKLFESRAKKMMGRGQNVGTSLTFNRGYAKSALALTFNANRSALQTVNQMREVVEAGREGAATLEKVAPFLSSEREYEMLNRYRERLDDLVEKSGADKERAMLERAISYLEALIQRKESARRSFADRLRHMSEEAEVASKIFSDEGLLKTLEKGLQNSGFQAAAEGEPPPDDENPFNKNNLGNGSTGTSGEVAGKASEQEVSAREPETRETAGASSSGA